MEDIVRNLGNLDISAHTRDLEDGVYRLRVLR